MAIAPDNIRRAKPLLGTFVEITVLNATVPDVNVAIEHAFGAIARVHRLMSFHDPESDVSRLNFHAASGLVVVDSWTFQVIEASVDFHRRSAGAFDIAIDGPGFFAVERGVARSAHQPDRAVCTGAGRAGQRDGLRSGAGAAEDRARSGNKSCA